MEGRARRIRGWDLGGLCLIEPLEGNSRKSSENVSGIFFPEFLPDSPSRTGGISGQRFPPNTWHCSIYGFQSVPHVAHLHLRLPQVQQAQKKKQEVRDSLASQGQLLEVKADESVERLGSVEKKKAPYVRWNQEGFTVEPPSWKNPKGTLPKGTARK